MTNTTCSACGRDPARVNSDGSPRSKQPFCMHCQSRDVEWINTGVRWRLFNLDANEPHRCERVASADDFDEVTDA